MKRETNHTKHEFACVMLFFEMPNIEYLHSCIKEEDIFKGEDDTLGIEYTPHVSLLMGLHSTVRGENVIETVKQFTVPQFSVKNISTFPPRPECLFEVLKFDVICPQLYEINKELRAKFPYTTCFEYHPHCTVAYMKKGCSEKYKLLFKNVECQAVPKKIVYSYKEHIITVNL